MDTNLAMPQSMVVNAILNRICLTQLDMLSEFGPEAVLNAANEVAASVGDVEEIGTSDVSYWVNMLRSNLSRTLEV